MAPTLFFLFAGLLAFALGLAFRYTPLVPAFARAVGLADKRSRSIMAAAYGFALAATILNGLGAVVSLWDWQMALWLVVIAVNILAIVFVVRLVKDFTS
ncbi:hypothetical protein [Hymenobacter edaphi]|uniref:hypothetical protein n=1 Tax=Hymenobacter edaphi TaxID=2211146 RepID=UPI001057E753|nr:hypothetical protein [Hymenobacter edaphi]